MAALIVESYSGALGLTVTGLDPSHAYTRNYVWQAYLNGSIVKEGTTSTPPYSSSASYYMSGLTNGLTYVIQAGIYSEDWSQQFALLYGSGTPQAAVQSGVYIWSGGEWKKATPHIYTTKNGVTKWWQANAYIYSGGTWK